MALAAAAIAWLAAGGAAAREKDGPEAYGQILALWAEGARNEAVLDLVTLEQGWGGDLDYLQGFQAAVLARLVRRDRLGLVAPARLHQLAFAVHATGWDRSLVAHSIAINDRAVKLSLKHGADAPEIRKTAAILLTSMAVLLREHRFVEAAAERLVRATELDPELAVAFEWGGLAEEQMGRLGNAAKLFRRLIELEPDHFPGRLHLAMVEAKQGSRAARGLLEGIVQSEHRSWVWIFAVQELARDDARSGRQDDATALLRRALSEFPRDQGLAVALAFYDRGHRGRSRATLEALESRGTLESARVYYSWWPRQEAFGSVVETTLVEHLPHLGQALDRTDEERR